MSNRLVYILGGFVLLVIAAVFWPVIHADFVWDDWQSFHDTPWLTQGDQWKHYIFRDFNFWTYYFRPLVVGFFALQVHLFHSTPGPMHAVSLAIHLIDTALVGILAWQCAKLVGRTQKNDAWMVPLCMAFYGLHAALIELVAWIGCQFDLIATMLMLLGLIANLCIRQKVLRAASIACLFFLTACSKESAVSFPLLLSVFDWIIVNRARKDPATPALQALIHRNWLAYIGILLSGCAYIAFRLWALGSVTNDLDIYQIPPFARLQEICFIYIQYWKILLWPFAGINPIHPFDIHSFGVPSAISLATTVLAIGIFIAGLYAGIKHASPLGCIVLTVTAALLPVLHLIPGQFEQSLYHERYATTALAVMCAMFPLLRKPAFFSLQHAKRPAKLMLIGATFLWLIFSVASIHLTLPLWSNDVTLWRWALATNPQAPEAKVYLLLSYVKAKKFQDAVALADNLLTEPTPCFRCMTTVAELALSNNDLPRATLALQRMREPPLLTKDNASLENYYRLNGRLLMQENKMDDAEKSLRLALALNPKDSKSQGLLNEATAARMQPKH